MKRLNFRLIVGGLLVATGFVAATAGALPAAAEAKGSTTLSSGGMPLAHLTVTMTVAGDFIEGGHVSHVVKIRNDGDAPSLDLSQGPEFIADLEYGFEFVTAEADAGTVAAFEFDSWFVEWDGAIAPGQTVTITIQATIMEGTAGESLYCYGSLLYDLDGDGQYDIVRDPDANANTNLTVAETAQAGSTTTTSTTTGPNTTAPSAAATADALPRTGIPSTGAQASIAFGLIVAGGILALIGTRLRSRTN